MRRLYLAGKALLLAMVGCGSSIDWDQGPNLRMVEYIWELAGSPKDLLVLVVDDRPTPEAAKLRGGVEAAMRRLARANVSDFVDDDPAVWNTVDMRVFIVPASSATIDEIASPATDASLGWTTVQARVEGADVLAAVVGARAMALAAPSGAPFRPLERAHAVVQLMGGW